MLRISALMCFCLVFLSACDDDQDKDFDELYEKRQVWESLDEFNYQMAFHYSGFTIGAGNYIIYVEQENVQTALYQGIDGEVSEYKDSDNFIFELATVANLFVIAEDAIANAAEYDITYDEVLGYPTEIVVDYATNIADDEFTYAVSEILKGSDIACTEEALPAITLALSLEGNSEANLCEAEVYIEDGEYSENLTCFDDTFIGAWERSGTYSITASYPGYVNQSIESLTVYPFICHVGTRSLEMELVESAP